MMKKNFFDLRKQASESVPRAVLIRTKISGGRMPDGKIGAFAKSGDFAGQDRSYAAVDDESQRSRFGQPVGHAGEFLVRKRNDDLLTARIGRKPAPAVDDRR